MTRLIGVLAALAVGAPLVLRGPEPSGLERLYGIWTRYESKNEGDPLRFYYFHDKNGIGLYRYGRVGLNYTNSYDYAVKGNRLGLKFRKTGESWDVKLRVDQDARGREWLVLDPDPREGRPVRYLHQKPSMGDPMLLAPGLGEPEPAAADWGRMWTDQRRYATGGLGFRIYQLKDAGADGRGIGWYHQGDYDEWSTESLRY